MTFPVRFRLSTSIMVKPNDSTTCPVTVTSSPRNTSVRELPSSQAMPDHSL